MTPGWVTTHRLAGSISRIRFIAVNAMVRAPSMPAAPPDSPVPAPRGTIGTSNRAQPQEVRDLGGLVGQGDGARQAGREVGRLVEPVRLAVGLVGEEPEVRAARARTRRGTRR